MFSVSISDNLRGHGQITLEAAGVAAEVDINVTEDETFMCAPITCSQSNLQHSSSWVNYLWDNSTIQFEAR